MLAPETLRAMIRLAAALHSRPAVFARKVFDSFLETHHCTGTDVLRSTTPPFAAVHLRTKSQAPDAEVVLVSMLLVPSFPCPTTDVDVPVESITVQGTLVLIPTVDHETMIDFPLVISDGWAMMVATACTG